MFWKWRSLQTRQTYCRFCTWTPGCDTFIYTSFDVKLFLLSFCCLLCHLISGPAQTPPVGPKWLLVCRDAKDELDIMSRPGLPLMAQRCAPLGLVSSGQACSETERADLIPPAGQIMRNSGISSGSLSHLHSLRIECEELHCRRDITHLQNNPSFVPCHCQCKTIVFLHIMVVKKSNYFMSFLKDETVESVNSIDVVTMEKGRNHYEFRNITSCKIRLWPVRYFAIWDHHGVKEGCWAYI